MEGFMDVFELGMIKSDNIRPFCCKLADFFVTMQWFISL